MRERMVREDMRLAWRMKRSAGGILHHGDAGARRIAMELYRMREGIFDF